MDQQVDSNKRKNFMMLATLMASAAYTVGFNPPGGVWQDGAVDGHLPGDPIMEWTHNRRYLVFFYFNAAAFALSLMVVVLTLILILKKSGPMFKLPLHLLMGAATLAFIAAFGAGACRDKFSVILFSLGAAALVINLPTLYVLGIIFIAADVGVPDGDTEAKTEKYGRKLLAPLSMFALTLSYVGGLSTPGGFWDSADGGHRPGDSIMHGKVLHWFYYFNIGQFFASFYCVAILSLRGVKVRLVGSLYMMNLLLFLIVAYTLGSSRGRRRTVGVICSLCAAVGVYVLLHVALRGTQHPRRKREQEEEDVMVARQRGEASALVQLLAGLAVAITYQAGMYPPGGVWQDGHDAGDPILQTTNPGRYKAFFYCNSVAFVASLLAIFLGQKSYLMEHHVLQAAMILDILSLIVAYAIGSCQDQISTMYALGIAAAVVVYVVVHVQYFTLGSNNDGDVANSPTVDKKGGKFLLFAILVAGVTYQAGLTPPGGFLLQDDIHSGHRAGDPVLQYNNPGRYKVFFYCNSVSFMISTVLLLLLVNPNLRRPAIQSHALTLCSAVSFTCLIAAFVAGSTQHLEASICLFVLVIVTAILCLPLLLKIYFGTNGTSTAGPKSSSDQRPIYLMTIAILVGSATYQAGLDPPGGSWQSSSEAGNPVMHDNRKSRYLVFLCGNTTSFVAAIYLIGLLLLGMVNPEREWFKRAIRPTVVAQYLGFLVAYAAGSSRQWKMSAHVGTLVIAVLAYVTTHIMLSRCRKGARPNRNSFNHRDQEPSVQVRVKREKVLADYLVQLRWIFIIFVVLPISSLISLKIYLGDMWSASKSDERRHKEHEDKVQKVVKRLKQRNPDKDGLACTARQPWMAFGMRNVDYKRAKHFEVDLSAFRDILEIDTERMVAKVEPLVTMGQISRATCPMNLSLAVVPELHDLTVGGLFNGYGIQGSSHKHGLFSDTVVAFEIVLADGRLVRATKDNEYSDLFYGVPWSQGTLGFLVSAEITLVSIKEYVKLTYTSVKGTLKEVAQVYADSLAHSDGDTSMVPDFIEGIVYSEEGGVLMTGEYVSTEEANKVGNKINNVGWWFKPWFYHHAHTALELLDKDKFTEYIPTRQYYHRHTRSLYWEGKLILPFGDQPWFRYLLGWLMPPKVSLLKATQGEAIRKYYHENHVIQDMLVPLYKVGEALEFVHDEMEVYPLWLCPHLMRKLPMKTMVHPEPEYEKGDTSCAQMFTNVGVHYIPTSILRGEEFNGIEAVRKMERWLIENNSFQAPHAVTELSESDFWRMFDASHYEHCRHKYGTVGTIMSLYDKSKKGHKTEEEVLEAEAAIHEPAYAQEV